MSEPIRLEQYQKPLTKAATGGELDDIGLLWAMDAGDRAQVQLQQRALVTLGPPLPPIHQILFC